MAGIGGENIGTAFIRIIADGDGLDESIRRQFDATEPSIREGGKNHADSYLDAFNEQFSKDFEGNFGKNFDELMGDANTALTERMARTDLAEEFFDSPDWKKFRARLENESGAAGALAGQQLEQRFRDSTNLEGLPAAIRASGPAIRQAQADIVKQVEADAVKLRQDRDRQFDRFHAEELAKELAMLDDALAMNKKFNADMIKLRQDRDKQFDLFNAQQAEAERLNIEKITALHVEALSENRARNAQKLTDDRNMLADAYNDNKIFNGRLKKIQEDRDKDKGLFDRFKREHEGLDRLTNDIHKFGDAAGTGFGRGSRNNFLNFMGSVVRNSVRALAVLPQVISLIGDLSAHVTGAFSSAFKDSRKAGDGLFISLVSGALAADTAIGELIATGLPGLIAFAGAALLAVAVLGPLVSVVSGLVAGVTAVFASLSFAVVGFLAPLAGLIAPISFAVAGLAAAFIGLDDAAKKTLKETIKPIVDGIKDLGSEVRKPILNEITRDAGALGTVFSSLGPLFHGIGVSIASTLRLITSELTGAGGKAFLSVMTEAMPHAINDLGEIFVHTFGGFGGIFLALIPTTQRFLEFMEKVSFSFSNFTNSARGQQTLKTFFDNAFESAKKFGNLLLQTGGLLADLIGAGRGTGNTIIDDLTNQVVKLRDFIAANPKGVAAFFENGLDTIRNVGSVIREIVVALARLDTPANRRIGSAIFGALVTTVRLAGKAFDFLSFQAALFVSVIDHVVGAVKGSLNAFASFLDGIGNVNDGLSHLPVVGGMFEGIADKLHGAADNVRGFADGIRDIPDPEVDSGPATEGLRGLGAEAGSLTSPVITPEVDNGPANEGLIHIRDEMGSLTSPVIEPTFDAGNAVTNMGALQVAANGFTSPVIEPQADVGEAQHDLGRLRDDIGDFGVTRHKPAILKIITEGIPKAKADLGRLRDEVPGGRGDNRPLKINIEAHAEAAHKQIKDLHDQLEATRSPVDLKVRTGSALGAITGLRKGIEAVKKPKPIDFTLGPRTGAAQQAITGLRVGINSIPALKTTKMDLRAVQAKKNADSLADAVNRVKSKTTKIDTLTGQAKKNADSLRDAIGNVKSKTTTMTNNTNQAKKNTDSLRDAIGNVRNKTVTMTANTGAARGAVAALAAGINNLHDKTITVTTLRNETIRTKREQVPLPGAGGQAPFAPEARTGPTGVSTGKTVNIDSLTLVSNSPDSRTVANEFLNSLVAASL